MFTLANIRKSDWIAALAIFLFFSLYYFKVVIDLPPNDIRDSDIRTHALIAYSFAVNHDKLPPNFLYDLLVALLSGFSHQLPAYYFSSMLLLSAAITAKFLVTQVYLLKYSSLNDRVILPISLSIMMLFIFPLPGSDFFQSGNFYLGQLPPNVWHNPTVIFVMPFAMLLFFRSYELLFEKNIHHNKIILQIACLIAINALIKPSLLFSLLPAVFIFWGYNKINSFNTPATLSQLSPYLLGVCFIGIEYYVIYQLNYTNSAANSIAEASGQSSVIIAPLVVWGKFSSNLLVAVITSLFFPLIYFFFVKSNLLKSKLVQFTIANFIIALGIWVLLAEAGERKFHANFLWQVVIATYFLFFSLLLHSLKNFELGRFNRKTITIIGGAFLLHFIWGVVYWIRTINSGYY